MVGQDFQQPPEAPQGDVDGLGRIGSDGRGRRDFAENFGDPVRVDEQAE